MNSSAIPLMLCRKFDLKALRRRTSLMLNWSFSSYTTIRSQSLTVVLA
ncbi:hypothetical protein RchiOBHm_Chr1g0344761 [Rosa chinensis]|uniref:Uncharacterized protein n=1 Tax=Rosa chinensis TaxID=74649 RepID=A0A2P6SEK5_ROSCH|nr:hypothetical protein RchiOBHm_Chr1g0344761 [Rosa chinensis]